MSSETINYSTVKKSVKHSTMSRWEEKCFCARTIEFNMPIQWEWIDTWKVNNMWEKPQRRLETEEKKYRSDWTREKLVRVSKRKRSQSRRGEREEEDWKKSLEFLFPPLLRDLLCCSSTSVLELCKGKEEEEHKKKYIAIVIARYFISPEKKKKSNQLPPKTSEKSRHRWDFFKVRHTATLHCFICRSRRRSSFVGKISHVEWKLSISNWMEVSCWIGTGAGCDFFVAITNGLSDFYSVT